MLFNINFFVPYQMTKQLACWQYTLFFTILEVSSIDVIICEMFFLLFKLIQAIDLRTKPEIALFKSINFSFTCDQNPLPHVKLSAFQMLLTAPQKQTVFNVLLSNFVMHSCGV